MRSSPATRFCRFVNSVRAWRGPTSCTSWSYSGPNWRRCEVWRAISAPPATITTKTITIMTIVTGTSLHRGLSAVRLPGRHRAKPRRSSDARAVRFPDYDHAGKRGGISPMAMSPFGRPKTTRGLGVVRRRLVRGDGRRQRRARPARRLDLGRAAPRATLQEISAGTAQLMNAETRAFIGADVWFCGIAVVAGLLTGILGFRFCMAGPARAARRSRPASSSAASRARSSCSGSASRSPVRLQPAPRLQRRRHRVPRVRSPSAPAARWPSGPCSPRSSS